MKNAAIAFRKANDKDAHVLAQYRVSFLHEVLHINHHPDSEELTTELTHYFIESTQNQSLITWVAEKDEKIVGTGSLVIWQAPPGYSGLKNKGKRGYILNMYVLQEYRGSGIASSLLDKLMLEAKFRNLEFVSLHGTDDGIKMYRNKGFAAPKFPELKRTID